MIDMAMSNPIRHIAFSFFLYLVPEGEKNDHRIKYV